MDFNIVNESGNAVLQTIHSSEGGRALKLLQKRNKMKHELEEAKNKIENKNNKNIKFGGSYADKLEEKFRSDTVGLVSAEEFREKRAKIREFIESNEQQKNKCKLKSKVQKLQKVKLSFEDEEEEELEEDKLKLKDEQVELKEEKVEQYEKGEKEKSKSTTENGEKIHREKTEEDARRKRKHLGKDPTVDTNFLPDKERDERIEEKRLRLIEEYYELEKKAQNEILEVTYSYWDGTGHRRRARIPKCTTIRQFLDICRTDLEKDFVEIRSATTENLMYIKEDLILPHTITFYELIKNKVRGKSGPLFHFDVHDDIRLVNDATIEKDESHAGKVVDRKWYEKNKHIFPASRWETYNPNKIFEKYTIHRSEDNFKNL